jgi:hypothetical protein
VAPDSRELPYGRASVQSAGPSVRVSAGEPLRLWHGPYPFDEPPDLVRAAGREARMDLLREHLKSLCRPWDKLPRLFLDAYFAAIADAIAAARGEIAALATLSGALFAPEDWSFAALRPLPQAHLPGRAEIAFWTGDRFIAIAFEGSNSPTRQEREAVAQLAQSGAAVVHIPARALGPGADLLAHLPPIFARFWEGVALPLSPFGPDSLARFG